jgi:Tfp pilus assembly protein PilP
VTEYAYETKGRRDPFRPLITPRVATAAKPRPKTGLASLEVNELKLTGIVWEMRGFYALVEAPNGAGYVLRVNDVIGEDARVAKITAETVTVEMKAPMAPTPRVATAARLVELRLRKEE